MDVRVVLEERNQLAPGESCMARLIPAAIEYWFDAAVNERVLLCEAIRVIGVASIIDLDRLPRAS